MYSVLGNAHHDGSSVVVAFRELQSKIKHVELDRTTAVRDRDKLLVELGEIRRMMANVKNEGEFHATDMLLDRRRQQDEIMLDISRFKSKIEVLRESINNSRRDYESKKEVREQLEEQIDVIKSDTYNTQRLIETHRYEIQLVDERCRKMQEKLDISPDSGRPECLKMESTLRELERELAEQKRASDKTSLRADALQNYMSLILQINGDLCQTVTAREQARSKIARLSAQFLSTPR